METVDVVTDDPAETPAKVAWNRVAEYYGIAFGACLLGLGLLAGVDVVTGASFSCSRPWPRSCICRCPSSLD